MGCCASTPRKPDPTPDLARRPSTARSDPSRRQSTVAPPPPEEETVVKEVLSETPTPKPAAPNPTRFVTRIRQEEKSPVPEIKKTPPPANADVSETSDVCSMSESVSTKAPEEEFSAPLRASRSPAKPRNRVGSIPGRDRTIPVRRLNPSPDRFGSLPARNPSAAAARKRDSGETSGRRSRSPATRPAETGPTRSGLGRSPSARKTGRSPGRVGSEVPERTAAWRVEETTNKKRGEHCEEESLDNPLVSLECFIFL